MTKLMLHAQVITHIDDMANTKTLVVLLTNLWCDTSHQKTLNIISYKHNLKMTISFYVQVEINLQGFALMLTFNERDGQLRLKCKFHGYRMIKHVVTSTMVCHHWTAVCDKQQCHRCAHSWHAQSMTSFYTYLELLLFHGSNHIKQQTRTNIIIYVHKHYI